MFTLQLVRLMLYFVQILRSVRHNARAADVRSDRDMTDTRPLAELTLVEAALRYVPVVVSFIVSTTDTLVPCAPRCDHTAAAAHGMSVRRHPIIVRSPIHRSSHAYTSQGARDPEPSR